MNTLILTIHILACVSLVILVLLQSGHQGMGVIFGGSSSTVFGSSGAGGFLSKLTVSVAVVFFVTSLAFAYIDTGKKKVTPESVVMEKKEQQPSPTAPAGVKTPASSEQSRQDQTNKENTGQESEEEVKIQEKAKKQKD